MTDTSGLMSLIIGNNNGQSSPFLLYLLRATYKTVAQASV